MQKISPEGKAKVQLQVVLHGAEGSATTFHFVNPLGTRAQLDDRNSVKELLQQLLPKFKRTLNSDLEEKNRYFIPFYPPSARRKGTDLVARKRNAFDHPL